MDRQLYLLDNRQEGAEENATLVFLSGEEVDSYPPSFWDHYSLRRVTRIFSADDLDALRDEMTAPSLS